MKLLLINHSGIITYHFNRLDEEMIRTQTKLAGKQWGDNLVGFFINNKNDESYVAVNIKGNDGAIESMEYVDLDSNKPEFSVSPDFINLLSIREPDSEITLAEFKPILTEILTAAVRARRWEVYPSINSCYPATH